MKHIYYFLFFTLILFSCKEDLTPSWLEVKNITFTTDAAVQGENTHDIVDAWVFIDGKEMGVWEIPFRMPVLLEGEHNLIISPGIKLNGETASRSTNKFYETYTATINLKKEETTSITPNFKYKSVTKIIAKEDFEDTGVILNPKNTEDSTKFTIISKTDFPEIVKYGNNCGKLTISKSDSIAKVITDLNLPIVQNEMYLEVDYLATNSFSIGIINETASNVQGDQGPFAGAFKTKENNFEWKKIYFPLSQQTNLNAFAQFFEFYIYAFLDNDSESGDVYIDNVRIVYF